MRRTSLLPLLSTLALAACASGAGERKAAALIGAGDIAAIGATAFDQLKLKGRMSADYEAQSFARCVAENLIAELPPQEHNQRWEILVFEDAGATAFALPGGKIGVHRELLELVADESQFAAVIAHELAHLGHQHPAARVSAEFSSEAAVAAVQTYRGVDGPQPSRSVYALLGLGPQVGVLRAYARDQEAAADAAAISLMARAGYPPDAAPKLWRTLDQAAQEPAWLANHPDPDRHVAQLEARLEAALVEYDHARAAGRQPRCR